MAVVTELSYEETRSRDGTTFSKKLGMRVTLGEKEGEVYLTYLMPASVRQYTDHVIEFVHARLSEEPCPAFVTGDKVKEPIVPAHPCVGCATENACPEPCNKWHSYVQNGGKGDPPKLAPKTEAPKPTTNLLIVRCSVCKGETELRKSASTGKEYRHCRKCNQNRKLDGMPFEPKGA